LEFNVPFQHKYGYIRDERSGMESYPYPVKESQQCNMTVHFQEAKKHIHWCYVCKEYVKKVNTVQQWKMYFFLESVL